MNEYANTDWSAFTATTTDPLARAKDTIEWFAGRMLYERHEINFEIWAKLLRKQNEKPILES